MVSILDFADFQELIYKGSKIQMSPPLGRFFWGVLHPCTALNFLKFFCEIQPLGPGRTVVLFYTFVVLGFLLQ